MSRRTREHHSLSPIILLSLALLFLISPAQALNISAIGISDQNYDSPPFITGNRVERVVADTDCDNTCSANVSVHLDNRTLIDDKAMTYDDDGRFIYDPPAVYTFPETGDWTVTVKLEDQTASNSTVKNVKFPVRSPVNSTLYIFLSAVAMLLLAVGFSGNRLFGILGVTIMFLLGLFMLQGQLSFVDGEMEKQVDADTKVVENSYDNWNTGYYHTVGLLISVIAGFLFMLFMLDPGGNA